MMQDQEQAQKTFVKDLQDGKDVQQSLDKFLDQQNDDLSKHFKNLDFKSNIENTVEKSQEISKTEHKKMMDHIQQSCSQNPHCTQQIIENASEICSQRINWKLKEEELFSSTKLFHEEEEEEPLTKDQEWSWRNSNKYLM